MVCCVNTVADRSQADASVTSVKAAMANNLRSAFEQTTSNAKEIGRRRDEGDKMRFLEIEPGTECHISENKDRIYKKAGRIATLFI